MWIEIAYHFIQTLKIDMSFIGSGNAIFVNKAKKQVGSCQGIIWSLLKIRNAVFCEK